MYIKQRAYHQRCPL